MKNQMIGIERIAAERKRQIEEEGFTAEYDEQYANGDLADAAVCYAMSDDFKNYKCGGGVTFKERIWPWYDEGWKPTPDNRIRELEKAGALIAAEIDRLLRARGKT
jgi:hypothetical protein